MKKAIGVLILSIMFFAFLQTAPADAKENLMWLHFIDVGQGDSILIQTPNQKNILIDAGPKRTAGKVTAYLKRQHAEQLDALIITHPHHDHIGGVPGILENIKVKAFYMPRLSKKTYVFKQMMQALKKKKRDDLLCESR
ncbi:MBL fold metallo-hydrolase [Terrilactibacillus sp. S3-3]|nr:MBL fold metallo-hydrolase [Terrilactibacillus sp. S3-3]